jgi:hypothetical protein
VAARLGGASRRLQQDTLGAQGMTVVGGELPVPAVDPALLPPLVDVLAPANFSSDLVLEDMMVSWIPSNATAGELCAMVNSADLPEAFLQGDISLEALRGYEEETEGCLEAGLEAGPVDERQLPESDGPPPLDVPNSGA